MNIYSDWVVIADSRKATLYEAGCGGNGKVALREARAIENAPAAEHEHHRPTLLGGSERRGAIGHASSRSGPQTISQGHQAEEDLRRFARLLASWLKNSFDQLRINSVGARIHIFAPAKLISILQQNEIGWPGPLYHCAELSRLTPAELAVHPAVQQSLHPEHAQKGA